VTGLSGHSSEIHSILHAYFSCTHTDCSEVRSLASHWTAEEEFSPFMEMKHTVLLRYYQFFSAVEEEIERKESYQQI